jgi:hypothetical protein
MSEWILILFFHVGILATGNSNSVTTAVFSSETRCKSGGEAAVRLVHGTVKAVNYVCVPR